VLRAVDTQFAFLKELEEASAARPSAGSGVGHDFAIEASIFVTG